MIITRKSEGLNEEEWMRRVTKLYNERQTLFPIAYEPLKRLYDQDYSIEEALLKDLTKGHMYAFMELHIKHELGEYTTTFRTDEQAKQFFQKFPEIRRELTL
ncbi:hypothetical protein [Ekhidna sp.]|uniref:hypothetical protein n=1 Tax=Ekhidna sp. TaxID=2608089 RepID=UPI003C7E253F